MSNPDRIPVIVGVAQVVDRPANVEDGLDSIGLMLEALRAAERDSGASLLDRLDWLGVMNQISFPDPDEHPVDQIATVASVIMDLTTREVELAAGAPSISDYSLISPAFSSGALVAPSRDC